MSKKPEKTFVIRGFNLLIDQFNEPVGNIEDKGSFKEVIVKTQAEAITTMLTDYDIGTMSTPAIIDFKRDLTTSIKGSMLKGECELDVLKAKNIIQIVDVEIELDMTDKLEVRAVKSTLREILKHWSEKSRVKNRRGFRSSAIKTPTFEYGQSSTTVKVQVLLSNAIIYSNDKIDITPLTETNIIADMEKLNKELFKRLDWNYNGGSFNHSLIGKRAL